MPGNYAAYFFQGNIYQYDNPTCEWRQYKRVNKDFDDIWYGTNIF